MRQSNDYDYVGGEPINGLDLDGRACWHLVRCGGKGAKETWLLDRYGNKVHLRQNVKAKIWSKHGITTAGVRKALRVANRYPDTGSAWRYQTVIQRMRCAFAGIFRCRVAESVTMRIVVDFRTGHGGTQQGVVTAYCLGMTVCPGWVNR